MTKTSWRIIKMNKTLTISLVAALGVAGGGAYVLMDSDTNYSEYVPEPVTALIGDYLPDNFKAVPQTVSEVPQYTTMVEEPIEEIVEDTDQIMEQGIQQVEPQVEEFVEDIPDQQAVEQVVEQDNLEQDDEGVVEIAMQEIQARINETSVPMGSTSSDPKVVVIEEKIVAASTKISKLDLENKELEDKFQKILRKNRELAKRLQEIDDQLAQLN
jgi:hypothetical protein